MAREEIKNEHESYGLIQIGRIQGSYANLFGTEVDHSHAIAIRISRGCQIDDGYSVRYHDEGRVVEVIMSPTQWAEAITTLNVAPGVPCTFRAIQGQKIEDPPERVKITDRFHERFQGESKRIVGLLDGSIARAEELLGKPKMTKAERNEVLGALGRIRQDLTSNLPFLLKCFEEQVEEVVVEAKGEIGAFLSNAIGQTQRIGAEAPKVLSIARDKSSDNSEKNSLTK